MNGSVDKVLSSFNLGRVQELKALLIEIERVGVLTVPELLHATDTYITKCAWIGKRPTYKIRKNDIVATYNNCPSCGYKFMHMGKVVDGIKYNGCPKCRYSEVV